MAEPNWELINEKKRLEINLGQAKNQASEIAIRINASDFEQTYKIWVRKLFKLNCELDDELLNLQNALNFANNGTKTETKKIQQKRINVQNAINSSQIRGNFTQNAVGRRKMSEWDIYQYLSNNPNIALNCEELQKRIKTPRIAYKVKQLLQKKYIKSIQGAIDKKRRNVRETWYFVGQPEHIIPTPKVIYK